MTSGTLQATLARDVFSRWTLIRLCFFTEKEICTPLKEFLQIDLRREVEICHHINEYHIIDCKTFCPLLPEAPPY